MKRHARDARGRSDLLHRGRIPAARRDRGARRLDQRVGGTRRTLHVTKRNRSRLAIPEAYDRDGAETTCDVCSHATPTAWERCGHCGAQRLLLADGSIGGFRRYAGFWRRMLGALIDLVIVVGPFALALALLPDRERLDLAVVAAFVLVAYHLGLLAWSGDSWGKRLVRAHVVEDDGRPIGRGRVSAREGVAKILESTAILGTDRRRAAGRGRLRYRRRDPRHRVRASRARRPRLGGVRRAPSRAARPHGRHRLRARPAGGPAGALHAAAGLERLPTRTAAHRHPACPGARDARARPR